jgi:hypothetical protein
MIVHIKVQILGFLVWSEVHSSVVCAALWRNTLTEHETYQAKQQGTFRRHRSSKHVRSIPKNKLKRGVCGAESIPGGKNGSKSEGQIAALHRSAEPRPKVCRGSARLGGLDPCYKTIGAGSEEEGGIADRKLLRLGGSWVFVALSKSFTWLLRCGGCRHPGPADRVPGVLEPVTGAQLNLGEGFLSWCWSLEPCY